MFARRRCGRVASTRSASSRNHRLSPSRRPQPSVHRLWFEVLEERRVLSAQALSELASGVGLARPFADGLGFADPVVAAAMANITTTGSPLTYSVDRPQAVLPKGGDVHANLAESRDLINLNDFRADSRFAGINGAGFSVVVLDTGIDLNHPFFGPDANGNGVADRIVYNADFITGGPNADDVDGHGSNVSSIIGSQDSTYSGMAPGVNLIHLQVLDDSGFGSGGALEAALQWVAANVSTYNIASVNMSLGFSTNDSSPITIPEIGISDELAAIVAQNVIIASASGNSFDGFGSQLGVGYPSSDPSSLSIGAVWDTDVGGSIYWSGGSVDFSTGADRLISFSQRHPSMSTIFAPGGFITGAAPGGGIATMAGTSQATPHIAGIAALMQQLAVQQLGRRLTQAEFAALIADTGVPIYDGDDEDVSVLNSNQWYHRVDVLALANAVYSEGQSDLSMPGGLSSSSPTASPGGQVSLDFMIANQSDVAASGFTAGVYLSTDATVTAADVLLTSFTDSLGAGEFVVLDGYSVAIPAGVTPGTYYIGVVADSPGAVAESDETNNVASRSIVITAPAPEIRIAEAGGDALVSGVSVIDFGAILQGAPPITRTFELTNDGPLPLDLGTVFVSPAYAVQGLPATVSPLSSVQFTVTLLSDAAGSHSSSVSFSTNDGDENPFRFGVTGSVVPPDDYGDDASNATNVTVPSTVSGVIEEAYDQDWFAFEAIGGTVYEFSTTLISLSDSVIELFAPDGVTRIGYDDDGGFNLSSFLSWVAPTTDVYYLMARHYSDGIGAYELRFNIADDHGDDAGTATYTSDPSSNAGLISDSADVDWFTFYAIGGVNYDFSTTLGTLGDSTLTLYDVDGFTQLAYNDDTDTLASRILWTAPKDGWYYLAVDGYGSWAGSYTLSVIGEDDHGDNGPNATEIGESVSGVIEVPFDVDWFRFDAIAGARYVFETTLGTLSDTVLRVSDVYGNTYAFDDDSGEGLASLIEWVAPFSGSFYLEVSGLNWHTGSYELSLTILDDHGNAAQAATAIDLLVPVSGVIAPVGDPDWFSFEATAGTPYVFATTLGSLSDSTLRLVGPNGVTQLAKNDDYNGDPASRIYWTAPTSGTYYLEVRGFADAAGSYSLIAMPLVDMVVDDANDYYDGYFSAGGLSLREAVDLARYYQSTPTISFAPSLVGQTLQLWGGSVMVFSPINLVGPGAGLLTIEAYDPSPAANNGDGQRHFTIVAGAPSAMSGLRLTGGDVFDNGGAIESYSELYLADMVIDGNSAQSNGGGVFQSGAPLYLFRTTIDSNRAGNGGGVYIESTINGYHIEDSTISRNTAATSGAGVYSSTSLNPGATAYIVNSTISTNTTLGGGGAVRNYIGALQIERSTITANSGGGVSSYGLSDTQTLVYSSIVAGNAGGDVAYSPINVNTFLSLGYNLVGGGNGAIAFDAAGDQAGANPLLSALADNGGPTQTHALLSGSPAVNAGDPGFPAGGYDQRGPDYLRVDLGRIDVGAYELQASDVVTELDLVLDNDDGPSVYAETGTWGTATATGYDGLTYRFASTGTASTAQWSFVAPFAGTAEIFVYHRAGSNRATSAAFAINTGSGVSNATVNQTGNSLTWVSLGTFDLSAGLRTITLSAAASTGGSVVIADAIRVVMSQEATTGADFNSDGWIDGADFLTWQRNVGVLSGAVAAQGDADGNGAVDAADLATWQSGYGSSAAFLTAGAAASSGMAGVVDAIQEDRVETPAFAADADLAVAYSLTQRSDFAAAKPKPPRRDRSDLVDFALESYRPAGVASAGAPPKVSDRRESGWAEARDGDSDEALSADELDAVFALL